MRDLPMSNLPRSPWPAQAQRPGLPASPAWNAHPLAPPAASRSLLRVLVADDNPVNLLLATAQLEQLGLVPQLAADGRAALALACSQPFDLILMDLCMPVPDGLAATAALRQHESRAARPAAPVMAYSSNLPEWSVLARQGISGCLPKPCSLPDLAACLQQWCPGYRLANGAN